MVQKKLSSSKLGVHPHHDKSERRVANLKQTSKHQECKNKAAGLKVKMKKSRSSNLSDINSPRSSASKRISLPGKPPPADAPSTITTPQKQSPNRAIELSPNYMKSTSSADAKRGSSLVSSRNSKSFSDSKLNSSSSISGNRLARTLTKSSSMKLVRSLTKTPSFKNARSTAKKCSGVALCADMNVQRATCSSTMKDSKFPQYLVLNPGGIESEGTSVEKVCPYTYCSLNGHHHSPVPPLKLFLSTRRRSLKTQRNFRAETLSPRRTKKLAVEESKKVEYTPLCKEEEFSFSVKPLMQEVEMDYFIEIYAEDKEDDGGANKDGQDANHKGNFSFAAELEDSNDITYSGSDVKQVAESVSDGQPLSEIDYEENHEQCCDNIPAEVDIAVNCPDAEKDSHIGLVPEKLGSERLVYGVNPEKENHEGTKPGDASFEATDMDWEDVRLFSEADYFIKVDLKSLSESEVNGKAEIKANDIEVTSHEEIPCDEIVGYISEDEIGCSEVQFVSHYPGQDVNNQNAEDGSLEYDQDFPDAEKRGEFVAAGGKERLAGSDMIVYNMILTEDPTIEGMAEDQYSESIIPEAENFKICYQQGDDKVAPSSEIMNEAPSILKENYDIQGTKTDTFIDKQTSDALMMSTIEEEEIDDDKGGEIRDQDKNVSDCSFEQELLNADCGHQVAENEQVSDASQSDGEVNEIIDPCLINKTTEYNGLAGADADVQNKSTAFEMCVEINRLESNKSKVSEGQNDPEFSIWNSFKDCSKETEKMQMEDDIKIDSSDANGIGGTILHSGTNSYEELTNSCNNMKWTTKRKRATDNWEEPKEFNPREPNYLPLVPEPETEKVDLRHQDMDERKNSEEWMLDHALQKAVNKLAPARKRKVALLVEAFETVLPINKCDTRAKNTTEYLHTRPIQACN